MDITRGHLPHRLLATTYQPVPLADSLKKPAHDNHPEPNNRLDTFKIKLEGRKPGSIK